LRKLISLKKYVLFATFHLPGEKNGKKFGMTLSIAPINVKKIKKSIAHDTNVREG